MKLITLGNSDFDLRNKVEVMFGGLTPTARWLWVAVVEEVCDSLWQHGFVSDYAMGRSETPTFRNLVHKSDRVQYIPKSFRFFVVFESRHDHVISGYHLSQSSHHRTSPPPLWYFSWFVSHHFVILQFFVEIVFIKPLYFAQKSCFFFDFEGIFSI